MFQQSFDCWGLGLLALELITGQRRQLSLRRAADFLEGLVSAKEMNINIMSRYSLKVSLILYPVVLTIVRNMHNLQLEHLYSMKIKTGNQFQSVFELLPQT